MASKLLSKLLHHCTIGLVLPTVKEMEQIIYVQAFMSSYSKHLANKGNNIMIQRMELALKSLPDSKTQE